MKKTNKKGFKLPQYKRGGFWDNTKDLGLALADNALTTVTSGAGANIIRQDQYDDTKFGRSLGETEAIKESMDSMSPIAKMYKKYDNNPQASGYTQNQQQYYDQAQPFAQAGSKVGEMWAMQGMSAMGNKKGTATDPNHRGQGQNMMGTMALQAGNSMYNSNGMYAQGGINNLPSNIIPMHGHMLAIPTFGDGGVNAEVEKQENTLNPDGTTTQFNGPSHDNGGIPTNLDPGTLIFSDRLKPTGAKKTFADLNKPNNTSKEDKVLENKQSNGLAKKTANLMKDIKNKNSLQLFQEQEALKEAKMKEQVYKDFMACGGMIKYKDGGIHIKPENRGKFTAAANRAGMGVQEYANHILSHKDNYSSTLVKRANFARNASKFKHPDGGPVYTSTVPSTNQQMVNSGLMNPTTAKQLDSQNYGIGLNYGTTMNNPNYQYNINQAGTPIGQGTTTPYTTQPTFTYLQGQTDASGRPLTYQQQWDTYMANSYKKAYGGIQKFEPGGRLQPMNSPEPELLHPSQFGYANYQDWNDLAKAEAAMNNPNTSSPQSTSRGNGPNWGNMAYQAGMWAANNAGELAYLKDQGKKYDKQDFYNYSPALLDPTSSIRDIDRATKIAAYDLADKSSGNSGNYLSNRSGLAATMALAKDKVRREYANANAGISNSGQQYNIQNKYMTDDINARNKGQALTNYYKSIGSMGTKSAQAGRDYQASQMDQKTLEMMGNMFSNYKYDPKTNSWIFKK